MLFSDVRRQAGASAYGLASTAAVAALTRLRQQTIPQVIDAPRFTPRSRSARPEWLTRLAGYLTHRVALAGLFATTVLVLATALPAWAALQHSGPVATLGTVHSSVGVTGTPATRVEDLGVTTFVGTIPFVQQLRYLDAVAGAAPTTARFVQGARQASLVGYLQDVGTRATLPYLNDASSTKEAIDTWTAAVAEAERRAAEAQRNAAIWPATGRALWRAPLPTPGTVIPGTTVTFYSCIGNGFCGLMANGQQAFEGAAACSTNLPFGTRFRIASDPAGRVFVCLDRGALAPTWVDIWFYDAADGWAWQSIVGTRSDIIIVE